MGQRIRDGFGGIECDEAASDESQKSSSGGDPGAEGAHAVRGFCGVVKELVDIGIALIENDRGFGEPRGRIFLEVENLKVGDCGVTRIDLMALSNQRLGKIVSPTGFGALDLDESGAHGFTGGIRFAALNLVYDDRQTLVHFFFIAGISAEKEIIHVEAIQHDQIAHGFDGGDTVKSGAGILAGRTFLPSRDDIHNKQERQDAQDQAKTRVQLFSDRHCEMPPLTTAGQRGNDRFCRHNLSSSDFPNYRGNQIQ